jgi:Phage ABA sandwich domain
MDNDAPMPVAGPELDAEVAEKVMELVWDARRCRICGWPLDKGPSPFSLINRGRGVVAGCVENSCSLRPAPQHRADAPAPYSSEWPAAMQVVEAMRRRGYQLFLRTWVGVEDVQANFVGTATSAHPGLGGSCTDDTGPLAICRAALRALEGTQAGTSIATSNAASQIAGLYIEDQLAKGRTIEIPSLGLTLKKGE